MDCKLQWEAVLDPGGDFQLEVVERYVEPAEEADVRFSTELKLVDHPEPTLPAEICAEMAQLQRLDVSSNALTALPEDLGRLSALTSLDASLNMGLRELPASIGDLSSLRLLDLSCCALSAVPPSLGGLRELRTLLLNNNRLAAVPPELGRLGQLVRLNLSSNPQLHSVPLEIADCGSDTRELTEVVLGGTSVECISDLCAPTCLQVRPHLLVIDEVFHRSCDPFAVAHRQAQEWLKRRMVDRAWWLIAVRAMAVHVPPHLVRQVCSFL